MSSESDARENITVVSGVSPMDTFGMIGDASIWEIIAGSTALYFAGWLGVQGLAYLIEKLFAYIAQLALIETVVFMYGEFTTKPSGKRRKG